MNFVATSVLLLCLAGPVFSQVANICPQLCHPNPQGYVQSQTECNQSVLRDLCDVEGCSSENGPGFECLLPPNSFIVSNDQFGMVDVVVEYSWAANQTDLDSATGYLDGEAGVGCDGSAPFLMFNGDNRGPGGNETCTVDIEGARLQGLWTDFTSIAARAQWFGSLDRGPATLRLFLQNRADGVVVPNSELSMTITPGVGTGCASTPVGLVKVTRGQEHTRFMLRSE
ncbi:hypothetical protein BWQ96_01664 [Gracilariopsis chorda]|uniref:Uncharacterized protein n=1 Tax=Gracilariopsis chorda TaxID=448386 RepID=A0A2V3J294_9FLOR|nr:hypothetical protein BWQ96_01664 [Gracilariopsis chorda]|eukprot:PXF48495.1 hypothetical protein BWQ96_01664 [Gracilariopsis chorda]